MNRRAYDGLGLRAALVAMLVLVGTWLMLSGCSTVPPGYDADTTPDHDGEEWVGGK